MAPKFQAIPKTERGEISAIEIERIHTAIDAHINSGETNPIIVFSLDYDDTMVFGDGTINQHLVNVLAELIYKYRKHAFEIQIVSTRLPDNEQLEGDKISKKLGKFLNAVNLKIQTMAAENKTTPEKVPVATIDEKNIYCLGKRGTDKKVHADITKAKFLQLKQVKENCPNKLTVHFDDNQYQREQFLNARDDEFMAVAVCKVKTIMTKRVVTEHARATAQPPSGIVKVSDFQSSFWGGNISRELDALISSTAPGLPRSR